MSKVGRNDPCPCGSGKKYKKCCEKKANVPFFQKKEIKHIQATGVSSIFQNAFGSQKAQAPESDKAEEVKPEVEAVETEVKEKDTEKKGTEEGKKPKKVKAAKKAKAVKTEAKKTKEEKEVDKKD